MASLTKYLKAKSSGSESHYAKIIDNGEPLELLSYPEMIDEMVSIFESNNITATRDMVINAFPLAEQFIKCLTGIVFIQIKVK